MPSSVCSPAWLLTAACPSCGHPLLVRHTRQGHHPFIGCAGYPSCHYTSEYEPALQSLAARTQTLVARTRWLEAKLHRLECAYRAPLLWRPEALTHAITHLITTAHPDRWQQGQPATLLAHEVTTALLALREQLRKGAPV